MIRIITLALVAALALVPAATAKKSPRKVELRSGATALALDPATAQVLTQDLGVAVGVLKPGKATRSGALRFPIKPSRLDAKTLAGTIRHRGGISFSKDGTTVKLRNFRINIDKAPDLTAKVGGARLSILDLDLSHAEITPRKRGVKVAGVRATLTAGAADALNQAFSTNAFAEGLPIGTATVNGNFFKRKK